MAITSLVNSASVLYDGDPVTSNEVTTLLALEPTITKAVDLTQAKIGDILTYTVTITNEGGVDITALAFTDVLPTGSEFVAGSFTENTVPKTPDLTGNTLTYTIPTIAAAPGLVTLVFKVEVIGG